MSGAGDRAAVELFVRAHFVSATSGVVASSARHRTPAAAAFLIMRSPLTGGTFGRRALQLLAPDSRSWQLFAGIWR